jgi:hypothetical protein
MQVRCTWTFTDGSEVDETLEAIWDDETHTLNVIVPYGIVPNAELSVNLSDMAEIMRELTRGDDERGGDDDNG